ncbi:unnamed protein product [Calypogeia fissa]
MSLDWIRLFKTGGLCATYCSQACVRSSGSIAAGKLKPVSLSLAMAAKNVPTSEVKADVCGNGLMVPAEANGLRTSEITADVCENGVVLPAEAVHIPSAAAALKRSEVIAVPTDTLYGFACDARSECAIQKIYDIKGRSATKPLAICVADVDEIELYGTVKHLPNGLLGALFPGPVTLILPRGDFSLLDKSLNPGLPSIGVRIPDDPFIRSLCRAFKGALALTSANLSSQPSTVSVDEFRHLWTHCSSVFDAGLLPPGRAGSTIVDLTLPGTFKIARDGSALRETQVILNSFGLSERTEEKSIPA